MIAVIGATGTIGSELVRLLSARETAVRALSRRPAEGEELPGVEWAAVDLADRDGAAGALTGAERLFLLTGNGADMVRLQKNAIAAARAAGVRHVVKLSALGASDHSQSVIGLWHHNVERALAESGLAWTVLRPHVFMQNLLDQSASIRDDGRIYSAAGGGRIPFVDTRDIAAVAAAVLNEADHEGRRYVLTGPEAISYDDIAEILGRSLARDVTHVAETDDEAWTRLRRLGLAPWAAAAQIALYGYQRQGGATATVSDAVERLTGRPARGFEVFARDHAGSLSG